MVVTTLACPNSSCTVRMSQSRKPPFHLAWNHPVAKPARLVHGLFNRMFSSQRHGSVFFRRFPKTVALFGFWNIHDCYHRNPLNVKRLSKTEALYNRYIYYIIILFLGLISVRKPIKIIWEDIKHDN